MYIRIKRSLALLSFILIAMSVHAQTVDTTQNVTLEELVVVGNTRSREQKRNPQSIETVAKEKIAERFSGNLMKSLDHIPGVQAMSIGSGFSKPMIRGVGFNRISVTENGIKQEGQQWGADHGLEIDAFNVEQVSIRKGPSSLLLGSDAMGGVIEIVQPIPPGHNRIFGSVDLLGRSVNGLFGGSLMLGVKRNHWFFKARYSEQHFGDYAIPTDTIVYLTQKIPITKNRLNNTAGHERAGNLYVRYSKDRLSVSLAASDAYQKVGFFPAAHGIPDASKVEDDGSSRDIDLPYSFVNHFKTTLHTKYWWDHASLSWDLGYQNNHREEWSLFHTHYTTQAPPSEDPDRELAFILDNFSSGVKLNISHSPLFKSTLSWDAQYQNNRIEGYSFLLPAYKRLSTGIAWVANYAPNEQITLSGGVRYDVAQLKAEEYMDVYLGAYLKEQGYSPEVIEQNKIRSYAIDRNFGDYSFSAGVAWQMDEKQHIKLNVGRSFRLPGANELASNGVHHSSFMHEQGDPTLDSEQGWQLDLAYGYENSLLALNLSPFLSWYQNYIYLQPAGKWSILPHAGQIYRYTQSEALFAGAELSLRLTLPFHLSYELGGEYIYTYNIDENIPLSFSPPAVMRNKLTWQKKRLNVFAEWQCVSAQNRVARNELTTPSAQLFNAGITAKFPFVSEGTVATLRVDNIFNTKYLNHLSFYRKVEIPEPGRNIQLSIKIPFIL